jgi:hypothetical protein
MTETLRAHRPILIIELDDPTRGGIEAKTAALAALLTEAGYGLERLPLCYPDDDWHVVHFVARAMA